MAKKKTRSNLKIFLILGILVLCSSLIFVKNNSNVLGTSIAAGKQLQIDWFKPRLIQSSAPNPVIPSQTPVNPSQTQNPTQSIAPIPSNDPNTYLCTGYPGQIPGVTCCIADQDTGSCYGCCSGACDVSNPGHPYCDAKPIIYLYPTKITSVDVMLENPGKIAVSYPLYPKNGWKNIEAHPDGTLIYDQKKYTELFYETALSNIPKPTNGFVVNKGNLEKTLRDLTTQLGLIKNEQDEFLQYWLPVLQAIKTDYIFISVYDQETKDSIDRVTILPKPDTFIQFKMYFKPVSASFHAPLLSLENMPSRIGFVAVEWGGVLDLK